MYSDWTEVSFPAMALAQKAGNVVLRFDEVSQPKYLDLCLLTIQIQQPSAVKKQNNSLTDTGRVRLGFLDTFRNSEAINVSELPVDRRSE